MTRHKGKYSSGRGLRSHRVLPHGEGPQPVECLLCLQTPLVLGESLADGAGLLRPQILGNVLLVLVELPDILLGGLVDDDVDAGDVLTHNADFGELAGGSSGHLGDAEGGELSLELFELLGQLFLLLSAQFVALHLESRLPKKRNTGVRCICVYSFTDPPP